MPLQLNGHEYNNDTVAQAINHLANTRSVTGTSSSLSTPSDLSSRYGRTFDGERDVWESLGYDEQPEFEDLEKKFRRNDIAGRIVSLPANDAWKTPPEAFDGEDGDETPFSGTVNEWLEREFTGVARRADIASGIGEYGLVFFGFADANPDENEPFAREVQPGGLPSDPREAIAFYEVFNQGDVVDWDLGRDLGADESDPFFNRPVEYELEFGDEQASGDADDTATRIVHRSRLIHIPASEPIFNPLKGEPRLLNVYNRLEDLEKSVGSAAEAQWHGADRKFQFDIRDEFADLGSDELDEFDDEVKRLVHDLQPYIKTSGMDVNVIGGEDIDPSGVVDELKALIAGGTGIPQRKLFGSERGEQASTQDRANWFDNVESRQRNYCEEFILRPAVRRLVEFGVVPEPSEGTFSVEWPNLFSPTEVEESEIQFNRARALKNMAPQGNTDLLPGGLSSAIEFVEEGVFPEVEGAAELLEAVGGLDEADPEVAAAFNGMVPADD